MEEQSRNIITDLLKDPVTRPLLQLILSGFAEYIANNYPAETAEERKLNGGPTVSHAQKAADYLEYLAGLKKSQTTS